MDLRDVAFTKTSLEREIEIPCVYTVHYFKYGMNFRFEDEKHDFWELIYIDSGNAFITSGYNKYNLKQGDAFLHRPNDIHNIYTDKEFSNSAIVSFDCVCPLLEKLTNKVLNFKEFEKILLNKIINEAKLSYSDKLNDLYLTQMTKKANTPFGGEQVIKNSLELLLVSLIRQQEDSIAQLTDISSISTVSDKIVESILAIMQNKLEQSANINLEEISFNLGYSKSHIKTQFKKKMGISILQYFIGLKIEKAKKLLSQQKFTISEISDMLGFSSVYYFSRQFKLFTNMSPTKYVTSINADNVL